MNTDANLSTPKNPDIIPLTLVEKLDPAIGQATSGIGALLSELIRRTLRTGVQRVDDELQGYVVDKVSGTLSEHVPIIEQNAKTTAEVTAKEAASDLVEAGISSLERKTTQADKDLEKRIERTAQELKTQVTSAQQELRSHVSTAQNQLVREIESAGKRVEENVRGFIAKRLEEVVAKSQAIADDFAKQLSTNSTDLRRQLAVAVGENKDRGEEFELKLAEILNRLIHEETVRKSQDALVREELVRQISQLHDRVESIQRFNHSLIDRIEELERPRGIRAIFHKLKSDRKAA